LSLTYTFSIEWFLSFYLFVTNDNLILRRNDVDAVEEANAWIDWYQQFLGKDRNANEPVSDLYYPIMNQLSQQQIEGGNNNGGEIVGMMSTSIYWRDMMKGISLPSNHHIIDIVFENQCNPTFTFRMM
jgi:hypothetical protein